MGLELMSKEIMYEKKGAAYPPPCDVELNDGMVQ
jgi:hypothetical protein